MSFELNPGEIVGITGRNGIGKTTLLRLVGGLLSPQSGTIHREPSYGGAVFFEPEASFYGDLTVSDNLAFYRKIYKAEVAHLNSLLTLFSVNAFKNQPFKNLSRGQKNRAGLTRAFMADVSLYLLDEPYSGLDEEGCINLDTAMQTLKTKGKTVVIAMPETASSKIRADRRIELS